MPGKRYSKDRKALAVAAASAGGSYEASTVAGVPASTIRRWVSELESMDDSELDALVVAKKRVMSGLWGILGVDALEFAQELRAAYDAKGFQSAMVAAGICDTKLTALGAPKPANGPSSTPSNPLIISPPVQGTVENDKADNAG